GLLKAKYGTPIDRQSAYEIITGRLAAAKQAAADAAAAQATAAGLPPPAPGAVPMTAAGHEREIKRPATEMAAQQRADQKARAAAQRQARADAKARDRMIQTGMREAGKVVTSRAGQDLLRGVFGTLFGKH